MEQKKNRMLGRDCPVCGSKDYAFYLHTADHFFTKESFDLVKCNACEFVFTNPIPDPEILDTYYNTSEYLSHQPDRKNLMNRIYGIVRTINIRKKYRLVSSYIKQANVLDIGTGTGHLLNHFKHKRWETTGIEPNEHARTYATNQFDLNVMDEKEIELLDNDHFDIVMMWHVLEHVLDLHERIRQIKRVMNKKGYLFIAVPNIDSPDYKKYNEYWAALDVPRHLNHFSEHTIKQLLQAHKLNIVAKHPMKLDAYYISLLSEGYKGNKLPYFAAISNGFKSNLQAKKTNNYSSMIFVASN